MAAAVLLTVAACSSTTDTHCCDGRDLSPDEALHTAQGEMGAVSVEDLRVGTGRVVQTSREVTLAVDAADAAGQSLGTGTIMFFAGPLAFLPPNLAYGGYYGGRVPTQFVSAVAGMRVGGQRRFTLAATGCGRRGEMPCGLFNGAKGGTSIAYPANTTVMFTVDAQAVCRPRIVLVTEYGIPVDKHVTAVERACD